MLENKANYISNPSLFNIINMVCLSKRQRRKRENRVRKILNLYGSRFFKFKELKVNSYYVRYFAVRGM